MSDPSVHHTSTMTYLFGAALLIGLVVVMVVVLGGKPSGTTMTPGVGGTTGAPVATAGTTMMAGTSLGGGAIAGISVSVILFVLLVWAASLHWRMNEEERAMGFFRGMRARAGRDFSRRRGEEGPEDLGGLDYTETTRMVEKAAPTRGRDMYLSSVARMRDEAIMGERDAEAEAKKAEAYAKKKAATAARLAKNKTKAFKPPEGYGRTRYLSAPGLYKEQKQRTWTTEPRGAKPMT